MAGLGRRCWIQGQETRGFCFLWSWWGLCTSCFPLSHRGGREGLGTGAANVGEPWGDREEATWCGKDVMAAWTETDGPGKWWLWGMNLPDSFVLSSPLHWPGWTLSKENGRTQSGAYLCSAISAAPSAYWGGVWTASTAQATAWSSLLAASPYCTGPAGKDGV